MKLAPKVKKNGKTSSGAVVQNNNLALLEAQLEEAERVYQVSKENVKNLRLKVFLAKNYPVVEGSHVMCDLFIGRNTKKCKCLVGLDWDGGEYPRFKVYPYKKEGGVSSKGYFAPENIKECLVEE